MTTPPTADSPTPERHRKPARADTDAGRLLRKLTPREAQTLAHLAAGHDLPRTAAALGVTPTTVRSYLQRALRKLGARTEAEALALLAGALPHPPGPGPTGQPVSFAGRNPADLGPASAAGPGPAPAADRARSGAAPGGEADGKRRRSRTGRPSPGPKGAAPGRAQEECTPDARAAGAATGPTRPAAPATRDGLHRPSDTGSEPAPPTAPGRPGGSPAAGDVRAGDVRSGDVRAANAGPATAAAASGDPGRTRQAEREAEREGRDAGPAPGAGHVGTPHRAPTAPEAAGARPTDRARKAEQEERDAAPSPAARAQSPAEPAAGPGWAALAAAAPSDADDDLDAEPPAAPAMGFEELYETAHTRLVQQMFLLTACRHRAVHCVRRAFGEARRHWEAVAGSGSPEGWVRVRACELALSPWHRGGPRRSHAWGLPHRRIKVRPADEAQAVLPDHDRLTDRDRALLKALRRLSRPQRRALVLHDGLGLPAAAVAVEVESTLAAAEGRVWAARAALARWVPDLVGPDPAAPGFADGLSGLLHRAAVRGCPEPHRMPVPALRARHRLRTASRTGAAALLTVAVGGATLATLAGVRPAELFRPVAPPAPALCLPADGAGAEPGVPLVPGGPPSGVTSIWCSPAPGLEAVLVAPRAQAVARWELPSAGRGAAPPPQGPAACRLWSPQPCTTGPTGP
ncbi:sigma factor-like helix-turn-helix DNA-binding protein [Kitasatospora sp. NPDC001547]|uniref:sigma factor-like helix-turn-helix DNA-binding protein n=1 Tax=Kitasatospora sp. NPDC001547 TaxID=3364015 RepID=UPI0036C1B8AF